MIQSIETKGVHIKSWVTNLEEGALEQAVTLAELPYTFHHVALMPDCHLGYGMPIGGVLATKDVVIPNAVGVDIGCGMRVIKTNIIATDPDLDLQVIIDKVKEVVPTGFKRHNETNSLWDKYKFMFQADLSNEVWDVAGKSLGTLGGGNHFIEFQVDEEGLLAVMVHSGSRNLGKQICDYYNSIAKCECETNYSIWEKDLAFISKVSKSYEEYLDDMGFCVEYAEDNRALIMAEVKTCINEVFGAYRVVEEHDVAHNYAELEEHYGNRVMVHRKGATSALKGELGIIPGSQGTASYIVEGLGNKDSFCSCSHGAGRKMGRAQAKRTLDLEAQQELMQGILCDMDSTAKLDEAPGAYKDIDEVMYDQRDLVKIVSKLVPLGVIKG